VLLGYCVVAAGWDWVRRPFAVAAPWYVLASAILVAAGVLAGLQPAQPSPKPGLLPGILTAWRN
jgi:hypothetical protein